MPLSPTPSHTYAPQSVEVDATPPVTAPTPARVTAPPMAQPGVAPAVWAQTLARPMATAQAGRSLLQLQRQYGNRYVQRVVQLARAAPTLVNGDLLRGGTVAPEMQTKIQRAQSGGQPLAPQVATQLAPTFGADLSGVRVHTDNTAAQLNQDLGARAFTLGRHIFFDQGQYSPNTTSGQQLLTHELTHVIQQGGLTQPTPAGPLTLGAANDGYEREADQLAGQAFNR